MLLAAEITLLFFGLSALVKGEASVGKGKKIKGTRARVWGTLLMLTIPVAMASGIAVATFSVAQQNEDLLRYLPLCDVAAILLCGIAASIVAGKAEAEPVATVETNALANV